ncbi:MAG: bifunctional nuclease family protein [Myxococcales bacterium]|nr:bifunctional nuclease family protein [Myxococcales bacterium]MDH5305691.1 bifunctional nuclease family protein [Myxococcales bacterium]MDH5566153.1 bifunctional nuclease family protein [Myxococcales bacterium]
MLRCARLLTTAFVATGFGLTACGDGPEAEHNVLVHVESVAVDIHDAPVLVLEEEEGTRWLPIWIGPAEARSIALEMEERSSPRPNTHDLARNLIRGLDAEVTQVVVTELKGGTYFATLTLRVRDRTVEIDSRPSDAVAIALRTRAPIYVRETVFAAAEAAHEDDTDAPGGGEAGREI